MLRVFSPLSEEVENLVRKTIGCCIAVHDALGPGMREIVYSRATAIELRANRILFEREKPYSVAYRGEPICEQRLDFVVGGEIVLEIKAIEQLANVHHSQLLHYLRLSRLRVGLLINFNVPVLRSGIVRKIL